MAEAETRDESDQARLKPMAQRSCLWISSLERMRWTRLELQKP